MSLENLENSKNSTWGGKRDGSGRKPFLPREQIEEVMNVIANHANEEVDTELGKKKRILHLLETLYTIGGKGNVMAIKEYLDRALGKSRESIDLSVSKKKLILNDDGDDQEEQTA